ncbi:MAG: TAXI family TRAP transporter solute-binding subunit [Acetobacteraceae bacterium]|nr:TAXI family TRAP transporter solute-binding subunit [Acetobacteraceae bacterium]
MAGETTAVSRDGGVTRRSLLALIAAGGSACASPSGAAAAKDPAPLRLGAMAPGTVSHTAASAIAELLTRHAGLETRVLPNAGEAVLVGLLGSGRLDLAVANALEAEAARSAAADGKVEPRVLARLFPLRAGLYVRADQAITRLADLAGKRVTAGFSASPAIARLLDALLAAGGITRADIRPVAVTDPVAGAARFLEGRADAFFFAIGAAKVIEVDAITRLRLLPVPDDPEALGRLARVAPEAYLERLHPRPGLIGFAQPISAIAFDNLLIARGDLDEDVARRVFAALQAGREILAARHPAFRELHPAMLTRPRTSLALHPAIAALSP